MRELNASGGISCGADWSQLSPKEKRRQLYLKQKQKRSIDELLSNEKYCRDIMLMKTVSVGSIGSKRIRNNGQAAKYLAMSNHPPIIEKEAFEAVQKGKARRSNVERTEEGIKRKVERYSARKGLPE